MNDSTSVVSYQSILDFWFPELKFQKWWFKATPELDQEIKTRWESFLDLYSQNKLNNWKLTPQSFVALIILLDQFPRNMYRGSEHKHKYDLDAQKLSHEFLDRGFDDSDQINVHYLVFALMPLRHSTKFADQEKVQSIIKKHDSLINDSQKHDHNTWERFKKASQQSLMKIARKI